MKGSLIVNLSRSYSEHIENVRSFVKEKTVIYKDFSILKEPSMFDPGIIVLQPISLGKTAGGVTQVPVFD